MRDYLTKYAATTRQKVDMALADRLDFAMRREGDKHVRHKMAHARRAATAIHTLLKELPELPDTQAQQLADSAATLRRAADSLEGLARFAKGYQAFFLAAVKAEEDAELEAFAQQRWGHDAQALEFEWQLLRELATQEGMTTFAQWMHGQDRFKDVTPAGFIAPMSHRVHEMPGKKKPREAAACFVGANAAISRRSHASSCGRWCHVGLTDYESYLCSRKAAAQHTQTLVHKLTKPATQ